MFVVIIIIYIKIPAANTSSSSYSIKRCVLFLRRERKKKTFQGKSINSYNYALNGIHFISTVISRSCTIATLLYINHTKKYVNFSSQSI